LLAVALVFGQAVGHGFVNYDDHFYVYANPALTRGLTAEGITWAFTTVADNFWHPLTWLSYLLDFQLYGFLPWGYHLTNVLLHAANAVLLFLVRRRMTGRLGPSALVAALFAIHPLRVESVAWVAERKDVLSGLFFMLTLGAYVGYVRHRFSLVRYVAVLVLFTLGLMAKPVLVTMPFLLLLLDYWPLGRMGMAAGEQPTAQGGFSMLPRLVVEKIPFLLLAAAFCVVTPLAEGEAVTTLDVVPMSWRIANVPVAYVAYLAKLFCPVGLAMPYLHMGSVPAWKVVGAVLLLLIVSAATLAGWRRFPYLLVGWLWYLGTLVPMLGLVQVGEHTMADRYSYVTQIGLYLALAWGAAQVVAWWPRRRWAWGVASASMLAVLMGCAWRQVSFWHDSQTLWNHALCCASDNFVAHNNLGTALADQGRLPEAIAHYEEAVKIQPGYAEAFNNLGVAFGAQGRLDEAIERFQKSLGLKPDNAEAHNNLGYALAARGRLAEATGEYQKALKIKPDLASAHRNLGNALAALGRFDEAVGHYQEALEAYPEDFQTHYNFGRVLTARGRLSDALSHFRKAAEIEPRHLMAHAALAWLLATSADASLRSGAEAVDHAEQATKLPGGGRSEILDVLAAAYAEAARFPEALAVARQALQVARQQNNRVLADALQSRIALYEAGKPFHLTSPPSHGPQRK
jgi:tetratricopeptide (TPR) repeat protein